VEKFNTIKIRYLKRHLDNNNLTVKSLQIITKGNWRRLKALFMSNKPLTKHQIKVFYMYLDFYTMPIGLRFFHCA
jgi:hypothetical protein